MVNKKIISRNFTITHYGIYDPINYATGTLLRKTVKYLAYALEHTEDGRPHLQGFMTTWDTKTLPSAIKAIQESWPGAHVELMKGLLRESAHYCSKENEMQEFGEKPNMNGVKRCIQTFADGLKEGKDIKDLMLEDPQTYCMYRTGLRDIHQEYSKRRRIAEVKKEYQDVVLYDWQQEIFDIFKAPADKRSVYWIYETTGDRGKSFFTMYCILHLSVYFPDPAKTADIKHGYNYEPIVIFDIPRSKQEHMDHIYTVIEQFKNGFFFDPKYETENKIFVRPHVLVFANTLPDITKLSEDRWVIKNI